MEQAEAIRRAVSEALYWRDALWHAIVADLARRNPTAVQEVAETLARQPVLIYRGRSTRYAAWAWRDLDTQARHDWLRVCEVVNREWIIGALPLLYPLSVEPSTDVMTDIEPGRQRRQAREWLWRICQLEPYSQIAWRQ